MVVEHDPLTRLTDEQLARALDDALDHDDTRVIWAIVAEFERRGTPLEV